MLTPEQKRYILEQAGTKSAKTLARELRVNLQEVRTALAQRSDVSPAGQHAAHQVLPPHRYRRWKYVTVVLVLVWACIVYGNTLHNQFVFDDISQIVENTGIRNPANIGALFTHHLTFFSQSNKEEGKFFRPIQSLTLMVDYLLWGLDATGYHITNILLHMMVCVLLFVVLLQISARIEVAALVALLYLVHPVHTEAVAYVSGRADSLCTIFLLAMLICQRAFWSAPTRPIRIAWYAALLIAFAAALLNKEFAMVFPFVLIFCEYCLRDPQRYTPVRGRRLTFYLPLIAMVAIWFVIKNTIVSTETMVLQPTSLATRLATLPRLIADYIRLSLVPTDLHMEYKLPFPTSVFQRGYFGPLIFFLVFVPGMVYLWRRGRANAASRIVFFGLGWFLIGLAPYLNIAFQLNAPFAEHWLYVPEIGFLLAVVYALMEVVRRNIVAMRVAIGTLVVVACIFSILTIRQNAVWRDPITFYTYTLRYAPYSATVYNNLALEYIKQKDFATAEKMLHEALRVDPTYDLAKENLRMLQMDPRRGTR